MTNQLTTDFSTLPPIMAVDFDGTLVSDRFPEIGVERKEICNTIRRYQEQGVKSILWTSRTDEHLEAAVHWCKEHNLNFDAINQNIPEVIALTGRDTRKVFADVYIDDKSCLADILDIQTFVSRRTNWLEKLV